MNRILFTNNILHCKSDILIPGFYCYLDPRGSHALAGRPRGAPAGVPYLSHGALAGSGATWNATAGARSGAQRRGPWRPDTGRTPEPGGTGCPPARGPRRHEGSTRAGARRQQQARKPVGHRPTQRPMLPRVSALAQTPKGYRLVLGPVLGACRRPGSQGRRRGRNRAGARRPGGPTLVSLRRRRRRRIRTKLNQSDRRNRFRTNRRGRTSDAASAPYALQIRGEESLALYLNVSTWLMCASNIRIWGHNMNLGVPANNFEDFGKNLPRSCKRASHRSCRTPCMSRQLCRHGCIHRDAMLVLANMKLMPVTDGEHELRGCKAAETVLDDERPTSGTN